MFRLSLEIFLKDKPHFKPSEFHPKKSVNLGTFEISTFRYFNTTYMNMGNTKFVIIFSK